MTPTLSPVLQLLLSCLGGPQSRDHEHWLRLLASLQPQDILAAAVDHHVVELLGQALQQLPAGMVAPELLQAIRQHHSSNALRGLAATRDYLRLQDALQAANVRIIAFKGMVLSKLLYDDTVLRNQGDIDVLIAPADIDAASAVLHAQGYGAELPYAALDAPRQGLLRRIQKDLVFLRAAPQLQAVELHWRLIHNPHMFALDFDTLWSRGQDFALGPRMVRTLSNEDAFIYLCAHGSRTAWYRLKWLADIAPFLERVPLDWPVVMERSAALNCLKAVGLALLLAERLLGVAVPAPARAATSAVLQGDFDFVLEALMAPACWWHPLPGVPRDPPRSAGYLLRFWRFSLMLGSGWRYRSEFGLHLLLHPEDVIATRLPRWLFWAYPLVRLRAWTGRALGWVGQRFSSINRAS
jgi:hypothetical protein